MDAILDWLFQSDLGVSQREDHKRQSSAALDAILQAEKIAKEELSPDHLALIMNCLENVWQYHSLDGQLQFERGFLFGAKIMLWIASQKIIAPEQ